MPSVWNFGNTTVRNPNRFQEGLRVFADGFQGAVHGAEAEERFAKRLVESGVVDSEGTYSDLLGRKWRSAFVKLGFITDNFDSKWDAAVIALRKELKLQGLVYELTPSGRGLLTAETIGAVQDSFLRQLLCHELPSPIETGFKNGRMKPFILLLQVLSQMATKNLPGVSMFEVAVCLQLFQDHTEALPALIAGQIVELRKGRSKLSGRANIGRFEMGALTTAAKGASVKPETLVDYADTTFRYSKMSGLLQQNGERLGIRSGKEAIVAAILQAEPQFVATADPSAYLKSFYQGAPLPTDNKAVAFEEIQRLAAEVTKYGKPVPRGVAALSIGSDIRNLEQGRYELIEGLLTAKEEVYAKEHSTNDMVKETVEYLTALQSKKGSADFSIPDAPSYLEWAVWRSFLAVDHIVCPIQNTRRFKLDEDLLPVNPAPGGGPDMLFEFDDYILVVEVTLTTSSRQEAAEGEPVRRHVAAIKGITGKDVYAIFIAPVVDNNTAETFRIGVWYRGDVEDYINIVPLSLEQFTAMIALLLKKRYSPKELKDFLDRCLAYRNARAPQWIKQIASEAGRWMTAVGGKG